MNVRRFDNSFFATSVYLLSNDNYNDVVMVDCGFCEEVLQSMEPQQNVVGVLLTHTHIDHIYKLNDLVAAFPDVKIYTNDFGVAALKNVRLNLSIYNGLPIELEKGSTVSLESIFELQLLGETIEIIPTPGHDPSCLTYRVGNCLFTGDSYIPGLKLVANFPKANKPQAIENELKLKKMEADGYKILAGHYIEKETC